MGGQLSSSVRSWVFGSYPDSAEPNRPVPTPSPFVLYRRGSMYFDDDGDLAHEFYEEGIEFINGTRRATLKRIQFNLIPQGIVHLEHPRLHVDLPVVLCETCDLNRI
uniref:Tumor suppressor 2, mitochondrial calcium regulator n=1 Tax=Eptatretus burgeri TaxID=7764 RepID=A0A8C4N804_EPTBU